MGLGTEACTYQAFPDMQAWSPRQRVLLASVAGQLNVHAFTPRTWDCCHTGQRGLGRHSHVQDLEAGGVWIIWWPRVIVIRGAGGRSQGEVG